MISKTRKPIRRRYHADPLAMFRVIGGASNFTASEQLAIQMPVRAAYDNILRGPGCEDDFHTLASAVNIALVAAEKIDPLVTHSVLLARDALNRTHARHKALGRWGFDGPAIAQVVQAIEIYEQLTELMTAKQLQDTMAVCIERMETQRTEEAMA